MKTKEKYKIIALLAIGLFSHTIYATTEYSAEGHLNLEITGFSDSSGSRFDFDSKPSSIEITSFDNSADDNTSISSNGDAFADAVSTPFSDASLIDIDTQSTGYADSPYAFAASDSFATGSFEFENTSTTETYTVEMLLNYSYSASVETDTPTAQQNGLAGIDIDLFGDFNLDQILAISVSTDIDQGLIQGEEFNRAISFIIGPNDFEAVYADISSYGESESVASAASFAAVPLPASIYLFGSVLAGLVVRTKIKSA